MNNDLLKAVKKHGSIRAAAKALGIPKSTAQDMYTKAVSTQIKESKIRNPINIAAPKANKDVKRVIFTSAQDQTVVHLPFLKNLEAYAKFMNAELVVAGFTYNKSLYEDHRAEVASFAEEVKPYLSIERYNVGKNVVFCGEMNILPTAVLPLSGLETYTMDKWGIFPHAKVQLKSIPTQKSNLVKMIMTTGAVTKPNYVLKKAGIKAQFHHVYGAVMVEVKGDGSFFCRHLLGDKKDGSFYDLDRFVQDQKITEGHNALAVTWGDLHIEKADPMCFKRSFGYDLATGDWTTTEHKNIPKDKESLLDYLKPQYQFFHDIIDFSARNHHNIKDPHFLFEKYVNNQDKVEDVIKLARDFLEKTQRDFCMSFVVESNHDLALMKWLKAADYREDPPNALFFLKAQLLVYTAIANKDNDFSVLEELLLEKGPLEKTVFLREDESFLLGNEIECAMHGHLGANGARGSSNSFSKMGPKANVAHTHSCEIRDGIYTAGISGSLDLGYNKGLSSWAHGHIITYKNLKRAILVMNNGEFFA